MVPELSCPSEPRLLAPPLPSSRAVNGAGHAGDDPDLADLRRAADGDQVAYGRIVSRNIDAITRVAERMLGSRAEAEDVAQDVLLRGWRQTANWRAGEARFSTWLHRVALSRCTDRLRARRETSLDDSAEFVDRSPPLDARLQQQSVALRVRAALATLAERQRAAVVLCHFEEMTNIEAAAALEISIEALESLLARGRRALRAALLPERAALIGDLS
ncbi:MAG: RNA polymerase sigma-70 factor [Xanthomonadaceae bacterium]|nr:RNA polymerase sigma-70 factor [Xanthomonadaceae bacterium]